MQSSEQPRFELVLTQWGGGLFKSVDRIEADTIELLKQRFEFLINEVHTRMMSALEIIGDDDIPF